MKKLISLVFLALLFFNYVVYAQSKYESKSFVIEINGTSTMHEWTSKVTSVSMTGEFTVEDNTLKNIHSATIEMQTKSIKSNKNSSLMDNRTYSTLKADDYPKIKYIFTKLQSISQSDNETTITLLGNLTLAGSTQATDLTMTGKVLSNETIEFTGTKKLLMSRFGIKPPSFVLGALKVGDEVSIDYTITLKKTNDQQ